MNDEGDCAGTRWVPPHVLFKAYIRHFTHMTSVHRMRVV